MTADQAWDQLRYLARLLRARQPIPDELADFIADAIEATEGKNIEATKKGKAFTDELELTARNRRKIEIPLRDLGVEHDFGDDPSENAFASRMANSYQVGETTIRNRLDELDEERRKEAAELSKYD
ncbi:hypothetical protein [Dechloromonas sp. H13]|uniref:hypothetical protein n=1 Tax=Dechloromonas sp. H13 TaxID=2570193 RepID=UPI0012916705|nr:hypothetical protein [Dechloromonas sp. H13]